MPVGLIIFKEVRNPKVGGSNPPRANLIYYNILKAKKVYFMAKNTPAHNIQGASNSAFASHITINCLSHMAK